MAATPRLDRPHRPSMPTPPGLREQFERAMLETFEEVGPEQFRPAMVIKPFTAAHTVSSYTCYQWVRAMHSSGRLSPHRTAIVPVRHRAADLEQDGLVDHTADDDEAAAVAGDVQPHAASSTGSAFAVVAHLEQCINAATDVMASARRLRHKPEQAKLLITASEHLRRTAETVLKLGEMVWTLERVNAFHRQIVAAIRVHCPAAANEILLALETISRNWMNGRPTV